eukprot:GHVS01057178.1.p1 GENE.GHVS01057178.1~~GHVS01057178.1.p1  ORF type:complete len:358 (-),score=49.85 GHVS01057178.1:675-1748(-)
MSYSCSRYVRAPESVATTATSGSRKFRRSDGVDGDSQYVDDCRRIQELIQSIQTHTSTITKIWQSGHPQGWSSGNHQRDIHEQMKSAKQAARESQSLLRRFGDITGGSAADKSQRRFMHQKLYNNYETALKALETAAQKTVEMGQAGVSEVAHQHILSGEKGGLADDSLSTTTSAYSSTAHSLWSSDSIFDSYSGTRRAAPPAMSASPAAVFDNYSHYANSSSSSTNLPLSAVPSGPLTGQTQKYLMPIMINSSELEVEMLRERQEGIRQIQSDIEGIHDLYQELSLQVGTQGTDLDSIENQMRQAAGHSEGATTEVQLARNNQQNRTRRLFLLIGASLLALIVVLVLLFKMFYSAQ